MYPNVGMYTLHIYIQLVEDVDACRARLDRAQKLIGGLGGERTRWTQTCADLAITYGNLVGDVLVSSGFVAYLGPFTPTFRRRLVGEWQAKLTEFAVPHTAGCDLTSTLADPSCTAWLIQQRRWWLLLQPPISTSSMRCEPCSVPQSSCFRDQPRYPKSSRIRTRSSVMPGSRPWPSPKHLVMWP